MGPNACSCCWCSLWVSWPNPTRLPRPARAFWRLPSPPTAHTCSLDFFVSLRSTPSRTPNMSVPARRRGKPRASEVEFTSALKQKLFGRAGRWDNKQAHLLKVAFCNHEAGKDKTYTYHERAASKVAEAAACSAIPLPRASYYSYLKLQGLTGRAKSGAGAGATPTPRRSPRKTRGYGTPRKVRLPPHDPSHHHAAPHRIAPLHTHTNTQPPHHCHAHLGADVNATCVPPSLPHLLRWRRPRSTCTAP